jgi:hypothetical protein
MMRMPISMLYKYEGWGWGTVRCLHAPTWNPCLHLVSAEPQSPSCARVASTPTHDVRYLYVWTLWRHHCGCYCADQLWHFGAATVTTPTRRRWSWSTTSSTLMCDYVGSLLQLFFYSPAHLVVTIHDLPLTNILGWHGRSSASVAYPFPYNWVIVWSHCSVRSRMWWLCQAVKQSILWPPQQRVRAFHWEGSWLSSGDKWPTPSCWSLTISRLFNWSIEAWLFMTAANTLTQSTTSLGSASRKTVWGGTCWRHQPIG